MASTSDFRNGLILKHKNEIWSIVDFQHVKPGKGGAFVRAKLKRVRTGQVVEETFRAGERFEDVRAERRPYQYLYSSGDQHVFMSLETYEQLPFGEALIGDAMQFLRENDQVDVLLVDDVPMSIDLPNFVELRVTETDPGVRGDTASGAVKPARLETGFVVQVPLFIQVGDVLRVDTRTRRYLERVS